MLKLKLIEGSLYLVERGRYQGRHGADVMASIAIADELGELIEELVGHVSCPSLCGSKKINEW